MSYLYALYETYNNNLDQVGETNIKQLKDKTIEFTLLPISHTTQTAHIEVIVTKDGNLYDAKVVNKEIITLPFTEESGSRSRNFVPHVLHDKLMYVAGDYVKYTGQLDKASCFNDYIKQLQEWCESDYSHPDVISIFNYVKKGKLIEDLIYKNILFVDEKNKLLKKWNENLGKERPTIFSVLKEGQESAFVRFDVHHPEKVHSRVWNNKEIYSSYSQFYSTKLKDKDICYVSGKFLPAIESHPNKLRNSGDKAKLISSNDDKGFTYRGRFTNAMEVANISYEVSQKAHNALKWLIEKQGKNVDGRVFIVWGAKNTEIPQVTEDVLEDCNSILGDLFAKKSVVQEQSGTRVSLARKYNQLISGINKKIQVEENEKVYVMILDAATTGRLAVLYYRNLHINEYFERLQDWHIGCSWRHQRKVNGEWKEFYGSPSFEMIAKSAYGPKPSSKLVKSVMERLLPCVIDGRAIPLDIVQNAIQRASNPVAFNESWEWEQALSVACSLVKKHYEKEEYSLALDKTNTNRDYLFGRLLAVADVLERNALSEADQKRATNAVRYMNAFVRNPLRVWHTIHQNLQPYLMRLGSNARRFTDLFEEISGLFNPEEFNDKPLTGKYLLGYYSQRQDLYTKKVKEEGANENDNIRSQN